MDKGIIHLLQKDARNNTTTDIAEAVDVSPRTVSNRISQLEADAALDVFGIVDSENCSPGRGIVAPRR
ncbi:winged helix-turn-helix transcriptional regulator [Halovivax limisalsi]|uniref:winged helix-turn-helix transcriptional regulator n=1 Tax=Halovivax limisalsi TaxID=1453760 RepID=UPI001FFD68D9|nr:winged helix-turn-helix transcriptional regulator [Halovivax limisalsi]